MVGDRISALPNEVLHSILFSLSTKEAVATSVLAKRWRYLWHSLSNFDFHFDGDSQEAYLPFARSVYNVLASGDLQRPIHRFLLRCSSRLSFANDVETWINVAVQRRLEHLDLFLFPFHCRRPPHNPITLPSCRTLVTLKLESVILKVPSVEFPSLKILHLNDVSFFERAYLVELLSGCPGIEHLNVSPSDFYDVSNEKPYKILTKLVKARICNFDISFEAVKYAEFLRIDWIDASDVQESANPWNLIPIFPNLTHLEFNDICISISWCEIAVEMLKRSPKLQFLCIEKVDFGPYGNVEWQYPPSVPECISSQLSMCYFKEYVGAKDEFQLARYILENETRLQSMTIFCPSYVEEVDKQKMRKRLSMCLRKSSSCIISLT